MKRTEALKLRESIVKGSELLPVEDQIKVPELFTKWKVGEVLTLTPKKPIRSYNDKIYELIQAHTTQADWTPDKVPALWKEVVPAGTIAPWKQPAGAHDAYQIGAKVTHNGSTWESTINANTTVPQVSPWNYWKKI